MCFDVHRYDASTVLKLLQEIANHAHWKINWNELVNKSSTGISSAKEYRILWRHLAYGYPLIDDYFENQYSSPMVCIYSTFYIFYFFFDFQNHCFFFFLFKIYFRRNILKIYFLCVKLYVIKQINICILDKLFVMCH